MKDLLEQLQQLAPLAEAATAGPWENMWNEVGEDADFKADDEVVIKATALPAGAAPIEMCVVGMIWYDGPHAACKREDAAFIAAARNLLTPENLRIIRACVKVVSDSQPTQLS